MPLRRRALRPALLSLLAAAVGFAPLLVGVTTPASAASTDIKINEIITNSSTVKDSIELKNTGAAAVDVSGWIVKDDNDTRTLAIAPNSLIQPGAYLVVTVDVTGGFGLGNGDQARIFLPDGTTLIDGHTFPSHSNPSWSRCPDGTGAFVQAAAESLGAANVCDTPDTAVKINEVESNDAATDWVELVNTGTGAVDISGWIVRDDKDTSAATVPAATSLAAGGYYAVDTNVATGSTNFGLGAPDMARVFTEDGTTLVDSYSWTDHAATTYGRCPNGTGSFTTTVAGTRAAANNCPVPAGADALEINEVSSSPTDFVEVRNVSSAMVDAADFWFVDNDPTHTPIRMTTESTPLQPGDLFSFQPDVIAGGFGLGSADTATVLLSDRTTVVDAYSWASHRTPSYGRCPDSAALVLNPASSPGAPNICEPVRINEVESQGGTPGDWVELVNMTAGVVDVSGWIFKDADNAHSYAIPAATTMAANGYVVLDEAAFGFGLGGSDQARLYRADGTALVDSHTWTTAASTSYGRCANGTGAFTTTRTVTKGASNDCPPPFFGVTTTPWPGSQSVTVSDPVDSFTTSTGTTDISGLAFDPTRPGVLWAIKNKNYLFKLTKVDGRWTKVTTGGWSAGKELRFAGGVGEPDTEGVTVGPDGAVYATTERDNLANGVALNKVLRFDPEATGTTLTATAEWNLDGDFPELDAVQGGSNLGFEGLTWVPDSYLVGHGFIDESTGAVYQPSAYPGHGTGLYFMALENDGALYAYALGTGLQHRVAKVASGFPHVMEVTWDPELQQLWTACDDTCTGQTSQLRIGSTGKFAVTGGYERPTGMPNLNNEGYAIAPQSTCANGVKEVVWGDDGNTGGNSLRSATLPCTMLTTNTAVPAIGGTTRSGQTLTATTGTWTPATGLTFAYQWLRGGTPIAGATAATYLLAVADKGQAITVRVTASATGYTTESATSAPVTVENVPLLLTAPGLAGPGTVGSVLSATAGTWDEAGLGYAFRWLRGTTPIDGAAGTTYTLTPADLGSAVSVVVTASRSGGTVGAPAASAPVTVTPGVASAATAPPAVSGAPVIGQVLTGTTGTWAQDGLSFAYQWLRSGIPIAGATGPTYTLLPEDVGNAVSLRVTASRAGYADAQATSAASTVTGPAATKVRLSVKKSLRAGARAALTVRVTGTYGPTGKVAVTLESADRTLTMTGTLRDGAVRLSSPRLKAGRYRVVAAYDGDALHGSDSDTAKIKVRATQGR